MVVDIVLINVTYGYVYVHSCPGTDHRMSSGIGGHALSVRVRKPNDRKPITVHRRKKGVRSGLAEGIPSRSCQSSFLFFFFFVTTT